MKFYNAIKALGVWLLSVVTWIVAKVRFLFITFPIPSLIVTAVLFLLLLLWMLWPSDDPKKDADDARDAGITKTAEMESQKGELIEQQANTNAAERVVANIAPVVKEAKKGVETARTRVKPVIWAKPTPEPVVNVNLDAVVANCEKVYPGECK